LYTLGDMIHNRMNITYVKALNEEMNSLDGRSFFGNCLPNFPYISMIRSQIANQFRYKSPGEIILSDFETLIGGMEKGFSLLRSYKVIYV
jgi:hypothetical protein